MAMISTKAKLQSGKLFDKKNYRMKFCSLCQPSSLLLTSMLCSVAVGAAGSGGGVVLPHAPQPRYEIIKGRFEKTEEKTF